jgi:hypothetical protein
MSWAGVLSTVDAHLVTAGATLTPAITVVRRGEPYSLGRQMIAYWYAGDREHANTLTSTTIDEHLVIRCYWPVPNRDDVLAAALEVSVQQANRAIQARLWGDAHLGENVIGLDIDPAEAGWEAWGEAWIRTLTVSLWCWMVDVETIAN